MREGERVELSGSIEHVIFRNPANGYTVLAVESGGEPITASGVFPQLSEGQSVKIIGAYRSTKYGLQVVAERVEVTQPEDEESIYRYLSSGLIKGVGEVTAERIVGMFGKDTLEVIEHRPDKLKLVKGISAAKAVEIANSFLAIKNMQKSVMFLQKLGLTNHLAMKVYDAYKDDTEQKVASNPYRLIEDVDGVGFLTADRIAQALGVKPESAFRMRAALIHLLKENAGSGNTCAPEEALFHRLSVLLGEELNEETRRDLQRELIVSGAICKKSAGGESYLALTSLYRTEKSVAARLAALAAGFDEIHLNIEGELAAFERASGLTLHGKQREAIVSAVNNGVIVITGGPGTGKTTIINCILTILVNRGLKVELVAPTGRAAKRLCETTGTEAKTIHRLLDLDFKDGKGYFTYNENTKLECGAVIVDEVSMVDAFVMNSLVKAMRDGSRLILVGDKDQLPSVGAGNVLADVIASGRYPVCQLTEIYRQGAESLIVTNAHRINAGRMPVLNRGDSDFFFSPKSTPQEVLATTLDMAVRRIPAYRKVDPDRVQVLCPMKKGLCGSVNLNARLQELLNPADPAKAESRMENAVFRVGDKVMQTSNNYQLGWRRGYEPGLGVFNGDIGRITSIAASAGILTVEFEDGRVADYTAADIPDLALAYAISIHKSQGSEFDIVLLPLLSGHRALFTRNLLYTAVTRARKMAVIVGSREAVAAMVANDYTEKRYSLLEEFIVNG